MKCLLFAVLFLIAAVGVLTFSTAETQAATSTKKTVKIKLADKSGRYLLDTGYNWWLKDKSGKRIGGFNYIKVPAGKGLSSGYYMFDKRGRLCKGRHFHKVNAVIAGRKFKGTFYFGGKNGSLYCKRGWIKIGSQKYLLTGNAMRIAGDGAIIFRQMEPLPAVRNFRMEVMWILKDTNAQRKIWN